MLFEDIINVTIKIRCGSAYASIVTDKNGDGKWYDYETSGPIDYEYKIDAGTMASVAQIVSAVTPSSFADMITTTFVTGSTISYMSAFEVLYVCAKMGMLKNQITSIDAKKYVYMGLMKEASTLKDKSMSITMIQKRPEPVQPVEQVEAVDAPVEVESVAEPVAEEVIDGVWAAAAASKKDKKKVGKKGKKKKTCSLDPFQTETIVSNDAMPKEEDMASAYDWTFTSPAPATEEWQ